MAEPKPEPANLVPRIKMTSERSLYGAKPTNCPASFRTCGDCNIYPCIIGRPVQSEEERNEQHKSVRKVPCEVYSRIVGYLRPVQNWNLGKKREFSDRVTFDPINISTGKESHNETITKGNSTTR